MGRNPDRANPGWPPVVVAGAYQTAVVLMRNLARRGLSVSCFDCDRDNPGFRTIYGKAYHCPNPDTDPAGWVGFMTNLARRLGGRPVLIPSADQFVSAIAVHAEALEPSYVFSRGGTTVQALLATKERQYDVAGAHGMPVPRTALVRTPEEAAAFGATAQFPCLLKPLHFRQWERCPPGHPLHRTKLVLAHNAAELAERYRMCAEYTPELVVQEVIEGPDTAKSVYLSCYGTDGRRLGSCIVRQLRTTPIHFGSASIVEPMTDPEIDTLCDRFLRGLGYSGLCEIELKRDSRDGQVKMIEANPRYSVTADAAPYAGVDLGWLHYLDLIGIDVTPVSPSGRPFRHIVLGRDFATVRSYLREGLLTWGALLQSYRPPVAFFDFDLRDFRLTSITITRLLRTVLGPTLRRFIPRREGVVRSPPTPRTGSPPERRYQ
jgi:D-aspartate ligase